MDCPNTSWTQPEVRVLLVGRATPDDLASEFSGVRYKRCLPQDGAFVVGIVSPDITALLSRDKNAAPAGKSFQNRRRAEVVIRTQLLRTIFGMVIRSACSQPNIILRILDGP